MVNSVYQEQALFLLKRAGSARVFGEARYGQPAKARVQLVTAAVKAVLIVRTRVIACVRARTRVCVTACVVGEQVADEL